MTEISTDDLDRITIGRIHRDEAGRLAWTVDSYYQLGDGTVVPAHAEFHTDTRGDGLWIDDWQWLGTTQFSLGGLSASARRRNVVKVTMGLLSDVASDFSLRYFGDRILDDFSGTDLYAATRRV